MKPAITTLALLCAACVSASEFDDLKQRYDAAQLQLAERQERVGSLGASVDEAQTRVRQLQNENERARVQLKQLSVEHDKLVNEQRQLTLQLTSLLEDRSRLAQSSEQLNQALAEVTRRKSEADRRVAEFKGLLLRFKSLIDAGTLKIAISDGRMVLQLPTDVLFDSGSAKLSRTGTDTIKQIASVLKEVPNRRYQVEGHTDNVPIHNPLYRSNWELASARGLGVVRAMLEDGIDPAFVSAASYGEFHPVANNNDDSGKRANRRIEIIVVPDLSLLPGYEELQRAVQSS